MSFDYKKEFKEFYLPKNKPAVVDVPKMNFVAVRGKGDPNIADGEYKQAMEILYGIAFTIKMSKLGSREIEGYFDYVVPPLEGLWRQEGTEVFDAANKDGLNWVSMIRLPDFVTKADFDWAVAEASAKKKKDFSKAEFFTYIEGLCVQCMHIGAYDDEPATIDKMHGFAAQYGYVINTAAERMHHEIYISDPRRTAPARLKTVLRLPVEKNKT